ncbi:MAG: hypothetical protein MUE44_10390 [Oscillatoriaceae cyanobacterium Prado104]|nr:hypothetical protein [Oscillatoriaceae cyanobacterium Prado104]
MENLRFPVEKYNSLDLHRQSLDTLLIAVRRAMPTLHIEPALNPDRP